MGSLEDQKSFGALHPQFWKARTATAVLNHDDDDDDDDELFNVTAHVKDDEQRR